MAEKHDGNEPVTIASYMLPVAKALDNLGMDSMAIFEQSGIGWPVSNDPLKKVPAKQIARLFQLSVEATKDPYFGLYASRFMLPSHIHALGGALLSSNSLLDFCKRIVRFGRFVAHSADFYLQTNGDEVRFAASLKVHVCSETQDMFWSFVLRFMRHLHSAHFSPLRVELARVPAEQGSQPLQDFFNAPVSFGCEEVSYVFCRSVMEEKLPTASPELAQLNDQVVIDYLAKMEADDIVSRVNSYLVEIFPSGEVSRGMVAEKMCMSERTLQTRLGVKGTTFQQLLDDTRYELACGYLDGAFISLYEIAYLLGFTDVSSFSRAFKRWSGESPSLYRQHTQ